MSFGERHFGQADLGDKRRTKRLVKVADQIVIHPGGTLPDKMKSTAELESLYHLVNCDAVTHQKILEPHCARTIEAMKAVDGFVLCIRDITELDFSSLKSITEMGYIGKGTTKGYLAFNMLAVDPKTGEVLGLAGQTLHTRAKVDRDETDEDKRNREDRESRLWVDGSKSLPALSKIVDVCDRGADTFEFLSHEAESGRTYLIRSSHNRKALVGHEGETERGCLHNLVKQCASVGSWKLHVPAGVITKTVRERVNGRRRTTTTTIHRAARDAMLCVSAMPVRVCPPQRTRGIYRKQQHPVWIIRVWEPKPPTGEEPLEWFLITNHPIATFDDAYEVVGWYERRWIIEEYHKAMKTGCGIENLQFTREQSLHAMIAILSVTSITLLNLRELGRRADAKLRKAAEVIALDYVLVLSADRNKGQPNADWTIHEFYLALARMGGYQHRKSREPGWLVLWRGWTYLQAMMLGARAAAKYQIRCART